MYIQSIHAVYYIAQCAYTTEKESSYCPPPLLWYIKNGGWKNKVYKKGGLWFTLYAKKVVWSFLVD